MLLDSVKFTLKNTRFLASPNHNDRPGDTNIDTIVIHCISLPPNDLSTTKYITDLFMNCLDPNHHQYFSKVKDLRVSSHLLIDRDGSVTQFVPFHKRAWHAGKSFYNNRSNYNDFSIGIELVGTEYNQYTKRQYFTLAKVTKVLMKFFPIKVNNIIGHDKIAPQRKKDPGYYFNWEYFLALL